MVLRFIPFVLLVVVLPSQVLFSQDMSPSQSPPKFWQKVRYGGGIGLSFGTDFFSGSLAPSAIYEVSESLALGVGLNGTYNQLDDRYQSTILGGSALALYNILPEIQLSTEFEQLNVNRDYDAQVGLPDESYWYPALFLGAGFSTRNVTLGIRYDVLYDDARSIYANAYMPFVRVFF